MQANQLRAKCMTFEIKYASMNKMHLYYQLKASEQFTQETQCFHSINLAFHYGQVWPRSKVRGS